MIELCGSQTRSNVFTHYAYGDPLEVYARYVGEEDNEARGRDAVVHRRFRRARAISSPITLAASEVWGV